ncbi:MAG: DUF2834 domain-containing protein [Acidobacteriota bacterium]
MKLRHTYLVLCGLGAVLPYSQLIPWVAIHGLNLSLVFRELFSTRIGGFFGVDVMVSAVVLFIFIRSEGRRLAIQHLWLPVLATLLVGVSFGLPMFLYMRQRRLDELPDSPLEP